MADKMRGTKATIAILSTLILWTLNYQPKGALSCNFINLTEICQQLMQNIQNSCLPWILFEISDSRYIALFALYYINVGS